MSSIEYLRVGEADYLTERDYRYSKDEYAEIVGHIPARSAQLTLTGSGVQLSVVSTADELNDVDQPKILGYDGEATVSIDATTETIVLSAGTGVVSVPSDVSADSLTIETESLGEHPIRHDSLTVDTAQL